MAKALFIIVCVLIICMYIQYYLKYNTTYRIVQATLANLDENVLFEKYPVLITDRIVKQETLLETLFKYKYMTRSFVIHHGTPCPYMTVNKYLLLYNIKTDMNVNIIMPTYKNEFKFKAASSLLQASSELSNSNVRYVTIKLKKQQTLILPSFWMYQTDLPHHTIALNDPCSSLIHLFHMWSTAAR